MSSNFLQRFKGKTQTISKDGVHNVLGGGQGNNAQIFTHSNGIAMNQKANTSKASNMNPSKKSQQDPPKKTQSMNKTSVTTDQRKSKNTGFLPLKQKELAVEKVPDNPFLISNPFYLDQQQRHRQQQQRKEKQRLQKLQNQLKRAKQDPKKGTYTSSMGGRRSSQTKKSEKQWIRMGGLGANIGGEQWQEKRKKQQKMQDFANQVKMINGDRAKVPKQIMLKRQEKKQDPRTKALQYSKNVPRPLLRQVQKQQFQPEPIQQTNVNQLSELQVYEMRHRQLKQMVRRDL